MGAGRLDYLAPLIPEICKLKDWSLDWDHRGVYLHLEASEFIEAVRNKRKGNAAKEAGDLLFTFLAILQHNNISLDEAIDALNRKITELDPLNNSLRAVNAKKYSELCESKAV